MSKALLIIDFQNDFTCGGALEVPGGDDIAEPVKRLAERFDVVVATRDWHPPDHASFATEGGPWPVHCVRGTHGADLHPAMAEVDLDAIVDVGRERSDEGDGARAFDDIREAGAGITSSGAALAAS